MTSSSSQAPTFTTETVPVSTTETLLNVNMTNVTKLTSSNFLMWNRQVHALLDGYDLAGYIYGTTVAPPPTITTDAGVVPNPAFNLWTRQDKLIYSGLLGAITMPVQPILSTTATSAEIWSTLTSTYVKPSRGHIQQVKQQIANWSEGKKSINEYFQGLTTRFDQLVILGKPLDPEDQVDTAPSLAELPEEYKRLVDQIESRDTALSLAELHEKLINQEAKLQSAATTVQTAPITAHYTNHRCSNSNNKSHNPRRGGYRGNQNWQQPQTWQQQQFNHSPSHQNSQANAPRGYQRCCQICGIFGHSARRCTQLQG